jgi:cytoskeletal protein RodZ
MTIGERLRTAREAKHLTIGDIARRTYIQPRFLQAIDEDNLEIIPGSHQKFFVREYAKVVGLDPEEVLSQLPEYVPPPPAAPVETRFDDVAESSAPVATAAPERERRRPSLPYKRGVKMSGSNMPLWLIIGAVVLIAVIVIYLVFIRNPKPSTADGPPPEDSTAAATTEILTPGGDDSSAASAAVDGASGDSLNLEGRATSKVWFTIVMDGKRSETGTLDSGGTKIWRADSTFRMSLGNAGGLQLYLNDKPLGTLGPPRSAVRNQLIDVTGIRKRATPAPSTTRRSTTSTRQQPRRQPRAAQPMREVTPTDVRPPGGQ